MRRDASACLSQFRKYMFSNVMAARDSIYRVALGIKSQAVENLLKAFSGVPTVVRQFVHHSILVLMI